MEIYSESVFLEILNCLEKISFQIEAYHITFLFCEILKRKVPRLENAYNLFFTSKINEKSSFTIVTTPFQQMKSKRKTKETIYIIQFLSMKKDAIEKKPFAGEIMSNNFFNSFQRLLSRFAQTSFPLKSLNVSFLFYKLI